MNFRESYAAALEANDVERVAFLEATAWDEAYVHACELDSPNSGGFDALHERIYEEHMARVRG